VLAERMPTCSTRDRNGHFHSPVRSGSTGCRSPLHTEGEKVRRLLGLLSGVQGKAELPGDVRAGTDQDKFGTGVVEKVRRVQLGSFARALPGLRARIERTWTYPDCRAKRCLGRSSG
jgi:hypothetical protein